MCCATSVVAIQESLCCHLPLRLEIYLLDFVLLVLIAQPFIYVENVGSENGLVRALQGVIESIGKATGSNFQVTRDVLPIIQV